MSQDLIDAIRVLRIELGIANDRVAQAAGLRPRDLDVLDVIDRDGPCTPSHLVSRTGVRAATLTGVLARLERDGWISRTVDPRDGRSAQVAPTARFDELRALYRSGDDAVARLAEDLDPSVRGAVAEFLADVTGAVRQTAAELDTTRAPGPAE